MPEKSDALSFSSQLANHIARFVVNANHCVQFVLPIRPDFAKLCAL